MEIMHSYNLPLKYVTGYAKRDRMQYCIQNDFFTPTASSNFVLLI